jgi:hypothetical protein
VLHWNHFSHDVPQPSLLNHAHLDQPFGWVPSCMVIWTVTIAACSVSWSIVSRLAHNSVTKVIILCPLCLSVYRKILAYQKLWYIGITVQKVILTWCTVGFNTSIFICWYTFKGCLWSPFCILPKCFRTCFYQSKQTVLMRNGFQQFSESLEWFGALFEFLKNFLWSPFGHPRYAVVPLCILPKNFKTCFYQSKLHRKR